MTLMGVSFTRSLVTGSPADLTIGTDPSQPYWLPEDGIIEPEFDQRNTFADDSPDVAGQLLIQSVTGIGSLGLTVKTQAADGATLKAQKRALEAAVRQFTYQTTLTLADSSDAYTSMPAQITWGTADSGTLRALIATCVITIPVQPL